MAMLTIKVRACNPVGANCYVLSDETGEACIVDAGQAAEYEFADLEEYIRKGGLSPRLLLFTHGHFDHVWGCSRVASTYGLEPRLHRDDWQLAADFASQLVMFFGERFARKASNSVQKVYLPLCDGERLAFGTHSLEVIATPGHSPGGVCLYEQSEGVLLTGDTLFRGSVGRTDLGGGDMRALLTSVSSRLLPLPDDTRVLPGHGPESTIGYEREYNPYLF